MAQQYVSKDFWVKYKKVLNKVIKTGITSLILQWLHSFLSLWNIKVYWGGCFSISCIIGRVVPERSVLSRILFTIFVYDLFGALDGLSIKYLLYIDDIFIYCTDVLLLAWHSKLQEALRLIAQWWQYGKLLIWSDKYYTISLSRRQGECEFDYCIK